MAKDTPIWLDIKTEYIDTNLDKVIDYLSAQSTADPFYEMTSSLLKKRVFEMFWELANQTIEKEEEREDKEAVLPKLRILGAFLLDQNDKADISVREAYFFFLKMLINLVPDSYTEDLCEKAIRCITHQGIISLGFNWTDLKSVNPEIIAYKITHSVSFTPEYSPIAWYQNKGSLKVEQGVIELYEKNRDDSAFQKYSSSLCILDDIIKMQTASSERIPQTKADDVTEMDAFTNGVIREQKKTTPSPDKGLKQYQPGDKMIVKFTGMDSYGSMKVETMEGDYEKISGIVPSWQKVYLGFYTGEQVGYYLSPDSYFEAVYKGGNQRHFDISDSFVSSMIKNTIKVGDEVNAVLKSDKGQMMWWTENGYPAYISRKYADGDYKIGDTAYIEIVSCASNAYVVARVVERSDETVDENESRSYCVDGFPLEEVPSFAKAPTQKKVTQVFVKGLYRLLFQYQQRLGDASERYRVLSICRILATMTEDSEAVQYFDLASDYIHNLVRFAKNETEKIELLHPSMELGQSKEFPRWNAIIRVLQAYGKEESEEALSDIIENKEEDPLIVTLAKLIQSSNRIDDVYPGIKNVIRNEITRLLAVETVDNADFEKASGPNLGNETRRLEFKTSFFFAPKDAKEKNQEKNVFKDLDSFLNSEEGGILYLGVNDDGLITGLENEINYLEHKLTGGNYKGLDGYIRFVTDRAKVYFDLDVRLHFRIESAYNDTVVRIQVTPYENGVVDFDGVAYVRNNNSSVSMDPATRRQLESKRLKKTDDHSDTVVALIEAIREERKVIFHSYASSNSGNVRDRNIEPFAFIGGHSFVWGYDLDADTNKLFRVSRIGSLEILSEGWTKKSEHKKGETDVFHFNGKYPIPIKLQLDIMARNLLIEEYPDAASDLYPIGENTWRFDTNVYNIAGVGRFYLGLANHITIVDAPELVEYVKNCFREIQKDF